MRSLRLVVGLAAASLALSGAPAQAATADSAGRPIHAIGSATATIPDVVFFGDDCYEFPFDYAVTPDAYAPDNWKLQFDVFGPNGDLTIFDGVYSSPNAPIARAGRSTFQLCDGLDEPGLYTAKFKLTTESAKTIDVQEFETQFRVRGPVTSTALTLPTKVKFHKLATATVSVNADTPAGLAPAAGYKVGLQYKVGKGGWKAVKGGTGKTNATGVAAVKFRAPAKGKVAYRAVTKKNGAFKASKSAPVRRKG